MNTSPEMVPTVWTSDDERFFRVAWDLFSPDFLAGAGTLLASYDSDAPVPAAAPSQSGAGVEAPAGTTTRATA